MNESFLSSATLRIYSTLGLSPGDSFKRTDWTGCRFAHVRNSEHAKRDSGSDRLITHRFQSERTCHVKSLSTLLSPLKRTDGPWERHTQFPRGSSWGHAANRWFAYKYSRAFSPFLQPSSQNWSLHFTDEECLEAAGTVVPFQSFAIPVPELQAMFFLAVFVSEIKITINIHIIFKPWKFMGNYII